MPVEQLDPTYEVVRLVLDEDYSEIEGTKEEKDSKIAGALVAMRSQYAALSSNGGPTYHDPVVRFAFVFCYVTSHANLCQEGIRGVRAPHRAAPVRGPGAAAGALYA